LAPHFATDRQSKGGAEEEKDDNAKDEPHEK